MARQTGVLDGPRIVQAAAVVVIVFGLHVAGHVLVPLILAVLIASALLPLVVWLERAGMRRPIAVGLVCAVALAVNVAAIWMVLGQLLVVANGLPEAARELERKLSEAGFQRVAGLLQGLQTMTPPPAAGVEAAPARVPVSHTGPLEALRILLQSAVRPAALTSLALILVLYLMISWEDVRERVIRIVSRGRLTLTTKAMDDLNRTISRVLLLQACINALAGLVIGAGLWALGVPQPALWGVLAGLLRWVPILGPVAAAVIPALLSVAGSDGWTLPLSIVALCLAVELVVGNWLEPVVLGNSAGVSTLGLLLCAVFWTLVWGIPGLLLSTPITIGLAVIGRYVPQLGFLNIVLGSASVLSPPVRFYQRLVGLDRDDASRLAHEHAAKGGLVSVYDDLCMPALRQIETDRQRTTLDDEHATEMLEILEDLVVQCAERDGVTIPLWVASRKSASEPSRFVCVPARDQADELAAMMLCAALRKSGQAASMLTSEDMGLDLGLLFAELSPEVVWVSAVPPFAARSARLRVRQLELRAPGVTVWMALWAIERPVDLPGADAAVPTPFSKSESTPTSLRDAVDRATRAGAPATGAGAGG